MADDFFVTGTDTGIGKTVFTALATALLAGDNKQTGVMKPIQTGCLERNGEKVAPDLEFVRRACGDIFDPEVLDLMAPVRLRMPASPHLAAAEEEKEIEVERIIRTYHKLSERFDNLFVEGAGGVLVPITEDYLMVDLMVELDLSVILVSRSGLGTINHTLLSLEVLKSRDLEIAGVIFNDPEPKNWGPVERDNMQIIEKISGNSVTGRLPHIPDLEDKVKKPGNIWEQLEENRNLKKFKKELKDLVNNGN